MIAPRVPCSGSIQESRVVDAGWVSNGIISKKALNGKVHDHGKDHGICRSDRRFDGRLRCGARSAGRGAWAIQDLILDIYKCEASVCGRVAWVTLRCLIFDTVLDAPKPALLEGTPDDELTPFRPARFLWQRRRRSRRGSADPCRIAVRMAVDLPTQLYYQLAYTPD